MDSDYEKIAIGFRLNSGMLFRCGSKVGSIWILAYVGSKRMLIKTTHGRRLSLSWDRMGCSMCTVAFAEH